MQPWVERQCASALLISELLMVKEGCHRLSQLSRRLFCPVLSLVLTGWLLSHIVSATPLPNAWQITDNSVVGGSAINYTTNLPAGLQTAALAGGFEFSVNA